MKYVLSYLAPNDPFLAVMNYLFNKFLKYLGNENAGYSLK